MIRINPHARLDVPRDITALNVTSILYRKAREYLRNERRNETSNLYDCSRRLVCRHREELRDTLAICNALCGLNAETWRKPHKNIGRMAESDVKSTLLLLLLLLPLLVLVIRAVVSNTIFRAELPSGSGKYPNGQTGGKHAAGLSRAMHRLQRPRGACFR